MERVCISGQTDLNTPENSPITGLLTYHIVYLTLIISESSYTDSLECMIVCSVVRSLNELCCVCIQ